MRPILGSLVVLALAVGAGCGEPAETPASPSSEGAPIARASYPSIWVDILEQRDRVHAAVSKGTDMWHPECKEVSAGSAAIGALAIEMSQRVDQQLPEDVRRRGVTDDLGYLQQNMSGDARSCDRGGRRWPAAVHDRSRRDPPEHREATDDAKRSGPRAS